MLKSLNLQKAKEVVLWNEVILQHFCRLGGLFVTFLSFMLFCCRINKHCYSSVSELTKNRCAEICAKIGGLTHWLYRIIMTSINFGVGQVDQCVIPLVDRVVSRVDSSVGRAQDWKSWCRRFDPASAHFCIANRCRRLQETAIYGLFVCRFIYLQPISGVCCDAFCATLWHLFGIVINGIFPGKCTFAYGTLKMWLSNLSVMSVGNLCCMPKPRLTNMWREPVVQISCTSWPHVLKGFIPQYNAGSVGQFVNPWPHWFFFVHFWKNSIFPYRRNFKSIFQIWP